MKCTFLCTFGILFILFYFLTNDFAFSLLPFHGLKPLTSKGCHNFWWQGISVLPPKNGTCEMERKSSQLQNLRYRSSKKTAKIEQEEKGEGKNRKDTRVHRIPLFPDFEPLKSNWILKQKRCDTNGKGGKVDVCIIHVSFLRCISFLSHILYISPSTFSIICTLLLYFVIKKAWSCMDITTAGKRRHHHSKRCTVLRLSFVLRLHFHNCYCPSNAEGKLSLFSWKSQQPSKLKPFKETLWHKQTETGYLLFIWQR